MNEKQIKRLERDNQKLARRLVCVERRLLTANRRLEYKSKKYDELCLKYQRLSSSFLGRIQLILFRIGDKLYFLLHKKTAIQNEGISETNKEQLETAAETTVPVTVENIVAEDSAGTVASVENTIGEKKDLPGNEKDLFGEKNAEKEIENITILKEGWVTQPSIMKDPVIMDDVFEFDWQEKFYELRDQICDIDYLKRIEPLVREIPDSNGEKYYQKYDLHIGLIADEFIYHTYKDVADFIYITPENYQYNLDFLLIVTSWRGLDGEWTGLGNPRNRSMRDHIFKIIAYYHDLGVRVVYYSKEDPGNYYVFLEIAQKCDYIFTTAEECLEHYRKDTEVNEIHLLPFAVNPCLHNPIGFRKYHFDEVLFAGTWWNKKYPERIRDMELVFQSILSVGKTLKLIDRNYSSKKADTFYPEKYLKYVTPEVPHLILQKINKLYSWAININTSKSSNTMFASRVYELQALGNLIISNPSVGMEREFPDIIVERGNGAASAALLSFSEEDIYERQVKGIRRVMTGETVYDRFQYLLQVLKKDSGDLTRKVGIVLPEEENDELKKMAKTQSYANKVLLSLSQLTPEVYAELDILAFFEAQNEYGIYYLEDMINAFKYTNSDFITRDAYRQNGKLQAGTEHDYVPSWKARERTVFWTRSYSLEDILNQDQDGRHQGYSVDHFNYNKIGA